MLKNILRTIAKVLSVLLAVSAMMSLIQASPDLQGPWQVVTARVLAILLPAAIARLLWRASSTRLTPAESASSSSGRP